MIAGESLTIGLAAGQALTVTATGTGRVMRLEAPGGVQPAILRDIDEAGDYVFGPYILPTTLHVACSVGSMTYAVGAADTNVVKVSRVVISAAALQASFATSIQIVPAPGPGKMIIPIAFATELSAGAPQSTGKCGVVYAADEASFVSNGTESQAVVNLGGTSNGYRQAASAAAAYLPYENDALMLIADGALTDTYGGIGAYTITAGGTGYAVGDTLRIGDTGARLTVATISEGGVVTGLTVTNTGSGCTISETPVATTALTGSGNTGLTLTISGLATPTVTATVTTFYTLAEVA